MCFFYCRVLLLLEELCCCDQRKQKWFLRKSFYRSFTKTKKAHNDPKQSKNSPNASVFPQSFEWKEKFHTTDAEMFILSLTPMPQSLGQTPKKSRWFFCFRLRIIPRMTDVRHFQTDRHTDIWINQYPCHWIKSNSSSHVLRRLQPAAHFVQGSSADPWASVGDCPDANQGGHQFIAAQFD